MAPDPAPSQTSRTFPEIVPELTDGHVLLRAHRAADAQRIVEQCQDPESIRWTTVPQPYDVAMAHEWVGELGTDWEAEDGNRCWAVVDANDPETFLGSIDIRDKGAGIGSIGFGLHPDGRGRHLMAAAVRLVTQWWFDHGGIRMHWLAFRSNFASWRVAHACGFTFHGIVPEHHDSRGTPVDEYFASVGRDDDLTRPVKPWHDTPVIAGELVTLRPWRDEDRDLLPDLAEDPMPAHFLPPHARPTAETLDDWLLRRRERAMTGGVINWCLADPSTDAPLGNVVLILDRHAEDTAELGYFLFADARGEGRGSEGARLALEVALRSPEDGGLGKRRVVATTVADNEASARLLTTLGFTETGRSPASEQRDDGSFDDARHWTLIPGDSVQS